MCQILTNQARAKDQHTASLRQPADSDRAADDTGAGPADRRAGDPEDPQLAAMTHHIPQRSLVGDARSHVFYGHEHGDIPISMFLVHNQPGNGPAPHRHPYAEVFVLHAGTARFRLDDDEVLASAGDIVIAPAGAAHGFTNAGPGELHMTCVHAAAEMNTAWLGSAGAHSAAA